jgi:uncharacterized protein (TIGR02246 family)
MKMKKNEAVGSRKCVEEEICRAIDAFQDGWNRHDMDACFSAYAEDAEFVNVLGQEWRGRKEIVRKHSVHHRDRFRDSVLHTRNVAIRFLRPDVAVVHVRWDLVGDRGVDGRGIPLRRGIITKVMARRKDRWVVEAAQNTDQLTNIPN